MKEVVADPSLVAYCGLYCGACRAYRKGRCPGCHENRKAGWCKIRACCAEHEFASCANCAECSDPNECGNFNGLVARFFALLFRSDRAACIRQIRELGIDGHAEEMARTGRQSLRR
jgi:hypothetical protein